MQYIFPCFLCIRSKADSDEITSERKVYASTKSAVRNEFYQAHAAGFKIEKVMTIRAFEYNNEEILKIGEDIFNILRAYDRKDGTIELILIKENRLYEEAATLLWNVYENGELIEHSKDVLIRNDSLSSSQVATSYQTGLNLTYIFKMKASDYEATKRIDNDTKKPLYATNIQFGEAVYEIVRTDKKKSVNEIELICE